MQLLFAAGDILAGWLIHTLTQMQKASHATSMWSVAAWLYNPFTVSISTRGSCDVLVVIVLLYVLKGLLCGKVVVPAVLYGFAVHFRIYPIVYAPAIVFFLAQRRAVMQVMHVLLTDHLLFRCCNIKIA